MANIIDRTVGWGIQRYSNARNLWLKANVDPQDRALIGSLTQSQNEITRWNDDEQRRIAITTSWIYADIQLLAREISAASISIKRMVDETEVAVKNHPAEILFSNPNPYMSMKFIWQYTVAWLELKGNGFWFLAPEMGDENTIAEIWPVPADRIFALPDKLNFLKGYAYKMPSGEMKFIKPQYIVHYQWPNPFSLLDGLAPLSAGRLALETEQGTSVWQRDTYVTGKGVPHSIISLDPDTNERDFIAISSQIRDDFEQERKIIVTRSGDLKVDKVGLSQKEMELVGQRQFTRDELDTVFLGFALHTTQGRELATMYKMFREETIFPMHQILADELTLQFIKPRYGNDLIAEFDDIRAQDRALNVQERNVYWRVKTLDEARAELGLPPIDDAEFPGLGKMLVMLATDPQFMMANYEIGIQNLRPNPSGIVDPKRKKPVPNSSLSNSDAPVNQLSDAAKDIGVKLLEAPSVAEIAGIDTELGRYKKVVLKGLKSGKRVGLIPFTSDVIPAGKLYELKGSLLEVKTGDDATQVFESFKADMRGGRRGRQNKQTVAVNAYQQDIEDAFDGWADDYSEDIAGGDNTKTELAIAALLLLLITLGRKNLPNAIDLAVGDNPQTPTMVEHLLEVMKSNEAYLNDSLIPDMRTKIQRALSDPDIQIAIGAGEGTSVIRATLATMGPRISLYAGAYWNIYEYTKGLLADQNSKEYRWNRDETVKNHCQDCLDFGDTTYPSFTEMLQKTGGKGPGINVICMGNCRCDGQEI